MYDVCYFKCIEGLFFAKHVVCPEASLVAQMVTNLTAKQETQVQSLGREDPLEKGTATHSSMLAWRIPRSEEPGGLQPMASPESDETERAAASTFQGCPGAVPACRELRVAPSAGPLPAHGSSVLHRAAAPSVSPCGPVALRSVHLPGVRTRY